MRGRPHSVADKVRATECLAIEETKVERGATLLLPNSVANDDTGRYWMDWLDGNYQTKQDGAKQVITG
jgi:hypothetical protein